jgi:hypothetical protein
MSSTPEVVSAKEMDKKRKENIKEGTDERGHWRWCECTRRSGRKRKQNSNEAKEQKGIVEVQEYKTKSGN